MKTINIARAENATAIRKKFLRIIDEKKTYIISKDSASRSVLLPIEYYEEFIATGRKKLPALAVLGARPCERKKMNKTADSVSSAERFFSKIIFVGGRKTINCGKLFKSTDVRVIFNGNPAMPIITSLKLAISALSPGDDFLVFCFCSRPPGRKILEKIAKRIPEARKKKKGILITKVNGRPSHPVAISRKYFKMVLTTRKELGIPYIIRKFKKDISYA